VSSDVAKAQEMSTRGTVRRAARPFFGR
jgi:hypothetical protein